MKLQNILIIAALCAVSAAAYHAYGLHIDTKAAGQRDFLQRLLSENVTDADGDGYLSKAELTTFAVSSFAGMVRNDATPETHTHDEFVAQLEDAYTKANLPKDEQRAAMANSKIMFKQADADTDGVLVEQEYVAFYVRDLEKMGWPDFNGKGIKIIGALEDNALR